MTLYRDAKGNFDSKVRLAHIKMESAQSPPQLSFNTASANTFAVLQEYELKVLYVDPAAVSTKAATLAPADLDMAELATSFGVKRSETAVLALRENPAWSVLNGDVMMQLAVVCLDEVSTLERVILFIMAAILAAIRFLT